MLNTYIYNHYSKLQNVYSKSRAQPIKIHYLSHKNTKQNVFF